MMFLRIAFLASHNGSSAKAIIAAIDKKKIFAQTICIISNNKDAPVFTFAQNHVPSIPTFYIDTVSQKADVNLANILLRQKVDLIVLSGYMKKIGPQVLRHFEEKILNVHPALPTSAYKGKGFYGDKIHQAVLDNKEKQTGVMIHFVDSEYDHGKVVAFAPVNVSSNDSVETLRKRVQKKEKKLFVEVVAKIAKEFAKS